MLLHVQHGRVTSKAPSGGGKGSEVPDDEGWWQTVGPRRSRWRRSGTPDAKAEATEVGAADANLSEVEKALLVYTAV